MTIAFLAGLVVGHLATLLLVRLAFAWYRRHAADAATLARGEDLLKRLDAVKERMAEARSAEGQHTYVRDGIPEGQGFRAGPPAGDHWGPSMVCAILPDQLARNEYVSAVIEALRSGQDDAP